MLFDDALDRYMAEVSSQKAKSTHRRKLYQARRIIDLTETKTDPRWVPLTVPAVEILAGIMPGNGCSPKDYVFLPKKPKMTFRLRPNQYFRESFEAAVSRRGHSS